MAEAAKNRNLLFHNGKIYTQDKKNPFYQAAAILNGKIAWLGKDADLFKIPTEKYKIIDLNGLTLIPSFIDAHMHYSCWAWSLGQVNLGECRSYEEVLTEIRKSSRSLKKGEWLIGKGWLSEQWEMPRWPHKDDLDRLVPNNPAVMLSRDQHTVWVNSPLLGRLKIKSETPNPPGGEIDRDERGEATGILKETAASLVFRILPNPPGERARQLLGKAQECAHALGITAVGNFDKVDGFSCLQDFHRRNGLKIRIGQYIPGAQMEELIKLGIKAGFGDHFLNIRGIKFFADGALGSQTAFMFAPYKGLKDNYGLAMYAKGELDKLVRKCVRYGLAPAIHAIGDRANHMALAALAAGSSYRAGRTRSRIEHCQILRKPDIAIFGRKGIVASVQPCHMVLDIEMINKYWGQRGRFSFPFKSLLNSGAILAFGSDAPIEPPNPLWNIFCAVTRKPPGISKAFYPTEKITVAEAISAHTLGAAYALGMEHLFGVIQIGSYADMVILDKDLYNIAPEEIANVKVMATLLEGEFVYGKESFQNW